MKTKICFLFAFCQTAFLFAQSSVRGSVEDKNGAAVAFATVKLLTVNDSSFVKGVASNDKGQFVIEKVKAGAYKIQASTVGFKTTTTARFEVKEQDVQLPTVRLNEDIAVLKEVQVSVKRPFLEQQIDRTVLNVANSIIGSGSTALEVLSKAPGITVDYQADQIELKGKQGVIVQIDGKPSYLSGQDVLAMLRSMSSDNIEKIEIITNPGAKYDAAGNSGIVNIVLKKDSSLGTRGSFTLAAGSGVHDRERGSLQVSHRTKKWLLFGNYGLNRAGNFFDLQLDRNQPDGNLRNYIIQNNHFVLRDLGHTPKLGVSYEISKNTTIGGTWSGFWNNHNEQGSAHIVARNGETAPVYLDIETQKTEHNITSNQIANLNFQHTFTQSKGQLSADFDLVLFTRSKDNALNTKVLSLTNGSVPPVEGLLNLNPSDIGVGTFKTDYNAPLSKKWNMETGVKFAAINSINDVITSSGAIGALILDPTLTSHFEYKERVYAAYGGVAGKMQDVDVKLGLRTEYTQAESNSSALKQPTTSRYLDWFPSLFVSKPLTDKQTLIFSYSHRIDRPNYQDLNPARGYVDLYAYRIGNIDLKPQYTHALELRYALKTGFFASLGANYISGYLISVNTVIDGNKVFRITRNMGNAQNYNLTVGAPFTPLKNWQMQANLMGFYNQFQFDYENKAYTATNFASRLSLNNGFVFGKGWTGELNGWVSSPRVNVIQHIPWLMNVDAGVQKAVSPKMKLKLSLQNVFNNTIYLTEITTVNSYQKDLLTMDTRVLMFTLSYVFGNQKAKEAKQRRTGSEEETRRTN